MLIFLSLKEKKIMLKIMEYDLFIFDFDGTILDTEKYHYLSWCKALTDHVKHNVMLTYNDFHEYFHKLDVNETKLLLKLVYDVEPKDYDNIYAKKQHYYKEFIKTESIEFIDGIYEFLTLLKENNKKFVIVTNTSRAFIEIFMKRCPILHDAYKIYTKEDFFNKKPNPECYLKIVNENEFKEMKKIGFEDSLVGFHALYQVSEITPVLIYNEEYFYTKHIMEKYKNIITLDGYNIDELNKKLYLYNNHNATKDKLFIDKILNNNILELQKNFNAMESIIYNISIILSNINEKNNIYMSGMGKSGYICKKSASTWQSLSIKCSYIDLPNLPHGDFGVFRDGDILILVSNGGNTKEVIEVLKYIKDTLKKKINIISIVANAKNEMEKYSNFTFVLNEIKEADDINMTPSTSSLIFMSLLDAIAINMKKEITKEEFKLYHPHGSLGTR